MKAMPLNLTILKRHLFVIHIAVINALVFNRSLLRKTDGLDLMTISEISMMSSNDFIVVIICFSSQNLMLCGSLKMMRSLTVINGSLVVNFVFVLGCHDIYSI